MFDLLGWTLVALLVVRALAGAERLWLAVGLAAAVALEVKTLPVVLLFALLVGVVTVGPRSALASRWSWGGAALAVVLWLPDLVWRARHGWPQLDLSSGIAGGTSGTSQPRWVFVPFQALLVSPLLLPVWVAGSWALARDPRLRTWRALAVAYAVLVVVPLAAGGKPYYLCGTYPALLAAGAAPTLRWVARGRRTRTVALGAAVVLSLLVDATLMLPVVPSSALRSTPIVAVDYDAGEQVGWPRFAATVGGVWDALAPAERARTVVIGANYGEAGAMARYRPDIAAYGGQNSYWDLARPPDRTTTAVVVGYSPQRLRRWFASVRRVARIDDGVDVDNDEQGEPVWLCRGPRLPWARLWEAGPSCRAQMMRCLTMRTIIVRSLLEPR